MAKKPNTSKSVEHALIGFSAYGRALNDIAVFRNPTRFTWERVALAMRPLSRMGGMLQSVLLERAIGIRWAVVAQGSMVTFSGNNAIPRNRRRHNLQHHGRMFDGLAARIHLPGPGRDMICSLQRQTRSDYGIPTMPHRYRQAFHGLSWIHVGHLSEFKNLAQDLWRRLDAYT